MAAVRKTVEVNALGKGSIVEFEFNKHTCIGVVDAHMVKAKGGLRYDVVTADEKVHAGVAPKDIHFSAAPLPGDKGDKIFISQKSGIKGISKKGSVFYEFAPNLADPISSFDVAGTHLHAAAQYSYTLFQDSRELHHHMCPGEVNSLLLGPSVRRGATTPQTALLGCSDRMIRVVQGGQFTHTVQVDDGLLGWNEDGRRWWLIGVHQEAVLPNAEALRRAHGLGAAAAAPRVLRVELLGRRERVEGPS